MDDVILPRSVKGYYGIGIDGCKDTRNIGGLWRSAQCLGAHFIFVIGDRYKYQKSDTTNATQNIPLYEYATVGHFRESIPKDCKVIGVEYPGGTGSKKSYPLGNFAHPKQAIYLLGAEDSGISPGGLMTCNMFVHIPSLYCLNVATTGGIIMFDRTTKLGKQNAHMA